MEILKNLVLSLHRLQIRMPCFVIKLMKLRPYSNNLCWCTIQFKCTKSSFRSQYRLRKTSSFFKIALCWFIKVAPLCCFNKIINRIIRYTPSHFPAALYFSRILCRFCWECTTYAQYILEKRYNETL